MKKFTFHYGHGTKSFELDEKRIIKEVEMPQVPPMTDVKAGVLDAIYHPIGCKSLKEIIKAGGHRYFYLQRPHPRSQ
jgi:hypothetical protein